MAQGKVLNLLAWFTGVIVSLVVGSAMAEKLLTLPWWLGGATAVGITITQAVGWIVVVTTLIGAVLAILNK